MNFSAIPKTLSPHSLKQYQAVVAVTADGQVCKSLRIKGRTLRANTIVVAVCIAAFGEVTMAGTPPVPERAEASSQRVPLDISSQPIGDALNEFAHQAGLQVVFYTDIGRGLMAPAVTGAFTAKEALERLLAGTGLHYQFIGAGTVVIRDSKGERTSDVASASAGALRLAQAAVTTTSVRSSAEAPQIAAELPRQLTESGSQLEEIIVSAQKREERLIDVPISIVALSGQELERRKVTSLDDLSLFVPGLSIQSSGSFQRRIVLRGISNIFGSSSLIGLYLDEADVTSASPSAQLDLRTYDLDRIEVLRGPQGTLYGAGSAGGTIRFLTKDPVLDRFEMKADVAVLFTQDGGPGQRIEAVVNVPLKSNELGLRIAGTFDHEGGWIDQPLADVENYNGQNLTNVRVKALWQPVPQLAVNALALIHRNDAAPNVGEDADGNYVQGFNQTSTPSGEDDYDVLNLTLNYDASAFRVVSSTSYLQTDKEMRRFGGRFPLTPPPSAQFEYLYTLPVSSTYVLTEELRLSSVDAGPWQWTLGGFYRDARALSSNPGFYFGLPVPSGAPLPALIPGSQSDQSSRASAVFGDASYEMTDRITIGAGLRYFEDRQEFASGGVESLGPAQSGKFHALSPRLYAQFKVSRVLNTYLSAAEGFRSGGFNLLNQPSYDPEHVRTYELGAKMTVADGRVGANAALFYSDYTDYQIVGYVPSLALNITSNAGSARIAGVELDLSWQPGDQWYLGLSGNYLDTEFYEINVASSSYAVGDPVDLIPNYTVTGSVQRDFDLSGKRGFLRMDYDRRGRATYRNRSIGPWYFSESDVISMLNFNASLQWSESLSLGLFVRNMLNDRGLNDPVSIEGLGSRIRPRTLGIEFGVNFD